MSSKVQAEFGTTINYEQQDARSSSPILLPLPLLRLPHYAKQFTCISVHPRGAGETDKPRALTPWNCLPTCLHAGDWR